jgi:hypothetical protein
VTDRNFRADQLLHAARAAGQPQPDHAELMAEAMRRHYIDVRPDIGDADGNLPCACADWREGGDGDEYDWDMHMAQVALAVVRTLLDAKQAEVDAWQRRHDDYEQAHRTLAARCAQLVFGARACTHLLRATADRCGTDEPPRADALRDFADDFDALADDKEPAAVILDAVRDRMLAASERQGVETHARLLAACDANLTGDDDGERA